ncbi:hypothetical protein TKK_0004248 [Trichogramma kaykai]
MRASTIRNLSLLCCLVVFVCGASSEKLCNCEHCRCAATSSNGAGAGGGGAAGAGAVVQVSNLPPPAATKVAYVADEVLSSFPTCKDCGEYHHHRHQPLPRSNDDHSSAQIYRQEAARRVSEPCRCQLKVGNGNELRTTIRLEPAQQREAVTKIVLPKSSPKSEQISSVSVVSSNVARIVKKKELLKKESETTLKPVVIDFEQLQKLLTSGSLTNNNNNNNNNAASDKDKRTPTPVILYVVAAPNAITLEKSKPIEAAKGISEPISEPATTTTKGTIDF